MGPTTASRSRLLRRALDGAHASLPLALNCGLPVLLGGTTYLLVGTPTLRVFSWAETVGLDAVVFAARSSMPAPFEAALRVFLPSGPDLLWVYATAFFLLWVWRDERRVGVALSLIPLVLAVGAELGQVVGLVPGYFDPIDLVAYFAGWAAALTWNLWAYLDER